MQVTSRTSLSELVVCSLEKANVFVVQKSNSLNKIELGQQVLMDFLTYGVYLVPSLICYRNITAVM